MMRLHFKARRTEIICHKVPRHVLAMRRMLMTLVGLIALTAYPSIAEEKPATGTAPAPRIAVENAPAPLYDDPVWHGASDPAVVWMPGKGENGEYWMYYTQRRATLENPRGVDWVHGSKIGIATSLDGLNWTYHGTAQGTLTDGDETKSLANPVEDGVT